VTYVDRAGNTWTPGITARAATIFPSQANRLQARTTHNFSWRSSRPRSLRLPVDPGIYEVHLLFAEDSNLTEATSRSEFSLNASDNISIDVVDDAGGDYVADTKVFRGIRPKTMAPFISTISAKSRH